MPDYFPLQIIPAAEKVQDFTRQDILHQRVHGKITPLRRFLRADKRID